MVESVEDRGRGGDVSASWSYVGVGCLTFFAGGASGAMISVLLAKVIGAARGCTADPETGAPCGWFVYAVIGGLVGALLLPTIVILRLRAGRARNSERG